VQAKLFFAHRKDKDTWNTHQSRKDVVAGPGDDVDAVIDADVEKCNMCCQLEVQAKLDAKANRVCRARAGASYLPLLEHVTDAVWVELEEKNKEGLVRWYPVRGTGVGFAVIVNSEGVVEGLRAFTEDTNEERAGEPFQAQAVDTLAFSTRSGRVKFWLPPKELNGVVACKHFEDVQTILGAGLAGTKEFIDLTSIMSLNSSSSSTPQPYQYKSLKQDDEIRLLKVEETSSSPYQQRFKFTLVHSTIDEGPLYETVSYVWGSSLRDRHLPLSDGMVLGINENLEIAILKLARWCSTGYLWIDQICINQASISERNHQVKLMGRIYGAGSCVLVWLGLFEHPSNDGILDWVCRTTEESLATGKPEKDVLQRLKIILLGDVRLRNRQMSVSQDYHELAVGQLHKHLGSEWFSRAWVYQEVVLSKQSKIILGESVVSLKGLDYICKAIKQIEDGPLSTNLNQVILDAKGLQIVAMMQRSWHDWHLLDRQSPTTSRRFEEFLSAVAPEMKTSDPRDRVYAFLGLNRDPSIQIEPDYSYTSDQVLISTTKAIIQGTRRLDIFEWLCRIGDGDSVRPFVRRSPSWVPNFNNIEHVKPFLRSTSSFHKSGPHYMYPHIGEGNLKLLVAHGKLLDRVQTRIDPRVPPYMEGTYFDFHHYVISAMLAWEGTRCQVSKPTKQTVFSAFLAQGHCRYTSSNPLNLLTNEQLPEMLTCVLDYYFQKPEVKLSMPAGTNLPEGAIYNLPTEQIREALSAIYYAAHKRYLFVTEQGRLVLGCTIEPGDEICILHGCSNPVALRPTGGGTYHVQETCFLEGWMDPWSSGKVDWKEDEAAEFILI
jgi:hypothetical protein